ncbi:MAG: hypothetical protein ACLSGF_13625 [Alistipes onderdonkii]
MSKVWSEENPNAYFPRARAYSSLNSTSGVVYYTNDRYIQNLAYCRLKNLTVGYTIPTHLTSKIGIKELRIYFSGENLATWTALKSKFLDPEQAAADSGQEGQRLSVVQDLLDRFKPHLLNNCRYEKTDKIYAGRNRRAGSVRMRRPTRPLPQG